MVMDRGCAGKTSNLAEPIFVWDNDREEEDYK